MSYGAVLLDMRLMPECVDAYVAACRTALDNDINLFLRAIAEVSRTLRVTFEKLGDEREALRLQLENLAKGIGLKGEGVGIDTKGGSSGQQVTLINQQRARALRGMEEIDRARDLLRPMLDKYARLREEEERKGAERASRMNIPQELMDKLKEATEYQRRLMEQEQQQEEQDALQRLKRRQERERQRREQRLKAGEKESVIKAEEMVDNSTFGQLTMMMLEDIEENKRKLGIRDEDLVLDEDGTYIHKNEISAGEIGKVTGSGSLDTVPDPKQFSNTPELDHHKGFTNDTNGNKCGV